jgi:DNA-binding IscR family transcriptional regulator
MKQYLISEAERITIIDLFNCVDCHEAADKFKSKTAVEEIASGIVTGKMMINLHKKISDKYNCQDVKIFIQEATNE